MAGGDVFELQLSATQATLALKQVGQGVSQLEKSYLSLQKTSAKGTQEFIQNEQQIIRQLTQEYAAREKLRTALKDTQQQMVATTGSTFRAGAAIGGLSFAVDDFVTVLQGGGDRALNRALMAAANNLSMVAMMINPMLALLPMAAISAFNFADSMGRTSEKAKGMAKDVNTATDAIKKLGQERLESEIGEDKANIAGMQQERDKALRPLDQAVTGRWRESREADRVLTGLSATKERMAKTGRTLINASDLVLDNLPASFLTSDIDEAIASQKNSVQYRSEEYDRARAARNKLESEHNQKINRARRELELKQENARMGRLPTDLYRQTAAAMMAEGKSPAEVQGFLTNEAVEGLGGRVDHEALLKFTGGIVGNAMGQSAEIMAKRSMMPGGFALHQSLEAAQAERATIERDRDIAIGAAPGKKLSREAAGRFAADLDKVDAKIAAMGQTIANAQKAESVKSETQKLVELMAEQNTYLKQIADRGGVRVPNVWDK